MAIDVLNASKQKHKHAYYHDLESLFYVLCWVCTVSAGPGVDRPSKEFPNSVVRHWNDQEPSEIGMAMVAASKEVNTKNDEAFGQILKDFHEYFKPIFGCISELRKCLFPVRLPEDIAAEFEQNYKKLKDEIKNGKSTDEARLQEFKKWRLRVPMKLRDTKDVFQDLYDAINAGVGALPDEHKLVALKDLPGEFFLLVFDRSRYDC